MESEEDAVLVRRRFLLTIAFLLGLPTSNGRIGATGMCLGGHLAFRCALDVRVNAAMCYFATDLHSRSLGLGKNDDSLQRAGDIKGELSMVFGKRDPHVPAEGRDLIRKTLGENGCTFSWFEPAWAQRESPSFSSRPTPRLGFPPFLRQNTLVPLNGHGRHVRSSGKPILTDVYATDAFIRDELSKGRYDPALAGICFEILLELFGRTLRSDLGARIGEAGEPEDVC